MMLWSYIIIGQAEMFSGLPEKYGIWGVTLLLLICVVVALWRKQSSSEERTASKLDVMEQKYYQLLSDGMEKNRTALENATRVQDASNKILERIEKIIDK